MNVQQSAESLLHKSPTKSLIKNNFASLKESLGIIVTEGTEEPSIGGLRKLCEFRNLFFYLLLDLMVLKGHDSLCN